MLYFEYNGKHIFGTLISNHGYYEYQGVPLWIYTEVDERPKGNFLAYQARPKESIRFVESIDSEPMIVHLPIIRLSEKLEILDIWEYESFYSLTFSLIHFARRRPKVIYNYQSCKDEECQPNY